MKYRVYGVFTATKFFGVFEAETADEAVEMGLDSPQNSARLCHQCSDQISLDDVSASSGHAESDED